MQRWRERGPARPRLIPSGVNPPSTALRTPVTWSATQAGPQRRQPLEVGPGSRPPGDSAVVAGRGPLSLVPAGG